MSGRQRDPAVPPAVLSPPGPAPWRAAADAPVSPAGPEPAGEAAAVPAAGRQTLPGRRHAPQRGRAAQGALAEQRFQQLPHRCVSAPRRELRGAAAMPRGSPSRTSDARPSARGRSPRAIGAVRGGGRCTPPWGVARGAHGGAQGAVCVVPPRTSDRRLSRPSDCGSGAGPGWAAGLLRHSCGPPHVSPDCVPSAAIRLVRLLSGPFSLCALH